MVESICLPPYPSLLVPSSPTNNRTKNYITSAALDCGLILSTLLIFFTLILTNVTPPQVCTSDVLC
jgi:hypothetical protein